MTGDLFWEFALAWVRFGKPDLLGIRGRAGILGNLGIRGRVFRNAQNNPESLLGEP